MTSKSLVFSLFISVSILFQALAQIPAGYYNGANGKSGYALKTSLHNIIEIIQIEDMERFGHSMKHLTNELMVLYGTLIPIVT